MVENYRHTAVLNMAKECAELVDAVVIGTDDKGGLQVFADDVNRDRLIVMLERAKLQLLNSIGRDSVILKDSNK